MNSSVVTWLARNNCEVREWVVELVHMKWHLDPECMPRNKDSADSSIDKSETSCVRRIHGSLLPNHSIEEKRPAALEPAEIAHVIELLDSPSNHGRARSGGC